MIWKNKVLVRVDDYQDEFVSFNPSVPLHWCLSATVVEAPARFFYVEKNIPFPIHNALFLQSPDSFSNVRKGYRVLLDVMALFEAPKIGDCLSVSIDALVCRIDPFEGMNGYTVVEMEEELIEDGLIHRDRAKINGRGVVVCSSGFRRRGSFTPGKYKPGDKVFFASGFRIESDLIRQYGVLVAVKTSDIHAVQS